MTRKNSLTKNETSKLKERIEIQKILNSIVDGPNLEISKFLANNYGQGWTSIGSLKEKENSYYSFTKVLVEGIEFTEPLPESCILLVKSLVNNYLSKHEKNVTHRTNFGAKPAVDYTFFKGLAAIQNVAREINSAKNQSILKFSETSRVGSLKNAYDSGF